MKLSLPATILFRAIAIGLACLSPAVAVAASVDLITAKREAEAKGFIFEVNHDIIVEQAKKEGGTIRVISSLEPAVFPHMIASFNKKYPFLRATMTETTGGEESAQLILTVKRGGIPEFDLSHVSGASYDEWMPHGKKFDIRGMAGHGILGIPPKMADPKNQYVVVLSHHVMVVAFNKSLISSDKLPSTWEGFLRPEFKDQKFIVDLRPTLFVAFAACPEAGMGEEWMVNFAKKISAQNPVIMKGHPRALTSIVAGEHAVHSGTMYNNVLRIQKKDPQKVLDYKIVEPVPVRSTEPQMVLARARNPYSALLFLEHEASREGQAVIDEYEPVKASIYSPGSAPARLVEGKRVCVGTDADYATVARRTEMAIKALGFPRAEENK